MTKVKKIASGTGFVVSNHNHVDLIITNEHVCQDKIIAEITTNDDNVYDGIIVKKNKSLDLCLIQVEKLGIHQVFFSDKPLKKGDTISKIGHGGKERWGYKKGVHIRTIIDKDNDLLELGTIEVRMGDSGSPVFNGKMEVVGVINKRFYNKECEKEVNVRSGMIPKEFVKVFLENYLLDMQETKK